LKICSILLILSCVFLNTIAEILMKLGMTKIGEEIPIKGLFEYAPVILSNPYNLVGLGLYGVSAFLWFIVLSREDLSFAYPIMSLTYALVVISAFAFFGEKIPIIRIIGILLIMLGVALVAQGS